MTLASDPVRLFTDRSRSYDRFVRFVGYPQGIRAFFLGSPLLRAGLRVLDAGCGTGVVALALRQALLRRGLAPGPMHAFDLTPAMLERLRDTLRARAIQGIDLAQADVLRLDGLPTSWTGYDLIVSASMLEYLPKPLLSAALGGLRTRLRVGGTFLLFITRRNWLTQPLIGRWWRSNLYTAGELEQSLREAGFTGIAFRRFPPSFRHLDLWGYIVEARGSGVVASRGAGHMEKVNLSAKLAGIAEPWRPKVVGELNGQEVKLVKFRGTFVWHQHEREDELFLGVRGRFRVEFRDRVVEIGPGEFLIVPRGVEHRTVADEEADVLVFEPADTRNTGNVEHPELTAPTGVRI
jgi:mannose-6-phosphate isomerase-like protein (cupin superfamily)/cyclopropane fatty-acyl-phospholipid synthase-like methyltransferase